MIAAQLTRPLADRLESLPAPIFASSAGNAPPAVIEHAAEAIDAGRTHYTDRPGILPLRQNISAFLDRAGASIKPDAITITCGVIESRFVAFKQMLKPGDSVAAAAASAADLRGLCALLSLKLIETDDLAAADSAQLIFTSDERQLAAALANPGKPWIVHLWRLGSPAAVPEDGADRVIIIGEFEQLPGWRVGWMAGSSAASKLRAYKQSMTICTPSVSQWAALGIRPPSGEHTP